MDCLIFLNTNTIPQIFSLSTECYVMTSHAWEDVEDNEDDAMKYKMFCNVFENVKFFGVTPTAPPLPHLPSPYIHSFPRLPSPSITTPPSLTLPPPFNPPLTTPSSLTTPPPLTTPYHSNYTLFYSPPPSSKSHVCCKNNAFPSLVPPSDVIHMCHSDSLVSS